MMSFFRGIKRGFKDFGHEMSVVVNSILLTFVYVFGVGLTWLFSKVLRKNFLEYKSGPKWHVINLSKEPIKKYYRMF